MMLTLAGRPMRVLAATVVGLLVVVLASHPSRAAGLATLVADINPGAGDANPAYLTHMNGALFFEATDGTHSRELWSVPVAPSPTATVRPTPQPPPPLTPTSPSALPHAVFMPLVQVTTNVLVSARRSSVFGVQINQGLVSATVQQAANANVAWARYGNLTWSSVESSPGMRNWAALSQVDAELAALSASGSEPIVTVSGVPAWAQQVQGSACGPISPSAQPAFASFMHDLVVRYSAPPYNVRYWEIWNEPDAPTVSSNASWGCWGNPSDAYYGGGAFGDMLKVVYPAIKAANPAAQVLMGGLLLDCDPTHPLPGTNCTSGKFFEGMLRNGAGSAFDLVAYHAYTVWTSQPVDWDLTSPKWQPRGGNLLGKLNLLQSVMNQYGVTNKSIMMDEGGLLYYNNPSGVGTTTYYSDAANYVVRLYTRAWANGLPGAVWYTLNGPGWLAAGLLDANQQPRPAYTTLQLLSSLLQGTTYAGSLSTNTIEGYAFHKPGVAYQIYWTNDGSTAQLTLPSGTQAVYDIAGQRVTTAGTTIIVGFAPIMVTVSSPD